MTTIAYDSAERVGTITLPDGTTQLFSSYQEQGWTNSGTSGSPAAATLLAVAATTYTDPNGNTFQIRPDWMGLGQLEPDDRRPTATSRPTTSTPMACPIVSIDPLDRITQYNYDSLGNTTEDHLSRPDQRPVHVQFRLRAADPHRRQREHDLVHLRWPWQPDGHPGPAEQPDDDDLHVDRTGSRRPDANNQYDDYQYDSQDRLTTIQFPDGTTNL